MLKLYNTLTRKKEVFKPLEDGLVKMYTCGLTVYDYAHIGNIRAFMVADILRRYFEYKSFNVEQVSNFTDVGHMIMDVDIGEDKLEVAAKREKKDPWAIADFYIQAFIEDAQKMNFKPMVRPRATDNIEEMIRLIKRLVEKDYAYVVNGSVYFDSTQFKDYGKLSGNTIEKLKLGASGRVRFNPEKRNQFDFALWINDPKHIMNWKSPWCEKGYPGWHIECSAMAMKYLGKTIDIHTGGVDNIFPHHENEIAQSEAVTGKRFVNYWLHIEHLLVESSKMSKSLGNFYTLRDLIIKGYDPKYIRYLLLATHYRQQLNFTFKGLEAAKNAVVRLENFMSRLMKVDGKGSHEKIQMLIRHVENRFEEAMDDDLNVSIMLAALFNFTREVNKLINDESVGRKEANEIHKLMTKFDKVLGIIGEIKKEDRMPADLNKLIKEREKARKDKNWRRADEIRKRLQRMGVIIEDTPKGPKLKYELKR